MSRTVRFPGRPLPTFILVILFVLAGCLAVHVLVEDLVFLSYQVDTAAPLEFFDELTHQDDLALSASLPDRFSVSRPEFVSLDMLPAQGQVFTPLRHPPKI